MDSDERVELQACLLQLAATDGMVTGAPLFVDDLSDRIVGHDEATIRDAASTLAAEHDWASFDGSAFSVSDHDAALEAAAELRKDVYG